MRIKRLELYGFKTFAKRTTIDFTDGMSAVVGPNGSGKSNIVDAVRWVLGEQSAKTLRGAKMHDVIFNGSDSQRQLNFAEVTITFDNTQKILPLDFQEVSVTRRVYRSGESEYLLNKQSVRLQDIHQLFLDTGVGKSSFSIIGQGQVAQILDSKPHERRAIFEEAAQVLKYKTRKEQALKKLQQTQEHLVRVQDIMQELETQLTSVRMQAQTAKQYLQVQEQLDFLQLHVFVADIRQHKVQMDTLTEQVKQWQDSDTQAFIALEKFEQQVNEQEQELTKIDRAITQHQSAVQQAVADLEMQKAQQQVLEERQQSMGAIIQRHVEDEARIATQLESFHHSLELLRNEGQSLKRQVEKLQAEELTSSQEVEQYQEQLRVGQQRLRKQQQQYERKQAEMQALQQINDSFQHMHAGTKYVLLAKRNQRLSGICGAVVELIEAESRFDTALETALGSALQHIVVESDQDAKQAIEYLKNERRGRATFLPLNTMKPRYLSQDIITKAKQASGFIGIGSQLVRFDQKYTTIIEYLLGQTLVMESISQAMTLAKQLQYRVKMVTLDGEIIHAGGSFTGGRQNQQRNGLLSQRHQIDTLEQETQTLSQFVHEEEQRLYNVNQALAAAMTALQQVKIDAASLQSNRVAKQAQQEQLKQQQRHFQEQQKRLAKEVEQFDDERQALAELVNEYHEKVAYQVADLATKQEYIQQLQQQKIHIQTIIANCQVEMKALRVQTKDSNQQLRATEIELSKIEVKLQNQLTKLSETYALTFEAADKKIGDSNLPAEARTTVVQLQKELQQLGVVNIGAIDEFDRLDERYTYLTTQCRDLDEARGNLLTVIEEMDGEMKQRFDATFTQIQTAFAEVFGQMFGGGTAQLVLTDAEFDDQRGIELHVQPPGKKMQHLSLLSGGERALTAICLLFAIIRVRPVPFSILDEVEAALDEHNVTRFASYVHRYSQESQFIVVTHRQGTMETADALYGVTMQQAGISTLVSVRLDEAKKMIQT